MKAKITSDLDSNWDREMLNTITLEIAPSTAPRNLEIVSCYVDLATALLRLFELGLLPNLTVRELDILERKLAEARCLLEGAAVGRKN